MIKRTSSKSQFLDYLSKNETASNFFFRFNAKDLFSNNWKTIQICIEQMIPVPKELLCFDSCLGMCFFTKYLTLVIPAFFTDEFLQTFIVALDKLPANDLNILVSLITARLSTNQKSIAVYQIPDCGSTFFFLGSLLVDEVLFQASFQRIFSSFNLVPVSCRKFITNVFRKSLLCGPARRHIREIIEIALHHGLKAQKKSKNVAFNRQPTGTTGFDIVISAIIDYYPDSLSETDPLEVQNCISSVFQTQKIHTGALNLLLLTNSKIILTTTQILGFVEKCPVLLYEYIDRLSFNESSSCWYLILVKASQMSVNIKTRAILLSIYFNFLRTSLSNPQFLSLLPSTQTYEWFVKFLNDMVDSTHHYALLCVFMLFMRCFGQISRSIINDTDFSASFEKAFNQVSNKILFSKVIFWALSPKKVAPMGDIVDFSDIISGYFPPPSSPFVFLVVPILLSTILKISIHDSTPKNLPLLKTPLRMNNEMDRTHSQVLLRLDDSSDDDENQKESLLDHSNNEEEEQFPSMCGGDVDSLEIQPLLKFIIVEITQMYKNDSISSLLYSLSTSQNLLPLLPFAHSNNEIFVFLSRALGLSCPFVVFATFYQQISNDFSKTIEFLAYLSEYTQLVTDFLYVTSEIPISLSPLCASMVLWVRPLSSSSLIRLSSKSQEILIKISETELWVNNNDQRIILPPKIGGWVLVTVSYSNYSLSISANLASIKIPSNTEFSQYNTVMIGDSNSHFDLQSARLFKSVLTEDDILYLFSLGPDFHEFGYSNFLQIDCRNHPSFITNDGFISELYIPYIHHYDINKRIETNVMSFLEVSLSPPFKSVRHVSRGQNKIPITISVDRRRSYSFLNSFHCHGGMHLLIHFIGEVILKKPNQSANLWRMIHKLVNYQPTVHSFFKENFAYALVGHLLWAGSIPAEDTNALALREFGRKFYLINPFVIEQWLFEGHLFHSRFPDIIKNIMDSMYEKRNAFILRNANIFVKIINLMCGSCKHDIQYLSLLGSFAVKLTDQSNCSENIHLVFDRLILCHFVFSESKNNQNHFTELSSERIFKSASISSLKPKIQPETTISLIEVLDTLMSIYPDISIDLELFLPAVVTSTTSVQISIVQLLIHHLSSHYLQLLGHLIKTLPYIMGIDTSLLKLLSRIKQELDYVQISTCFLAFLCHEESVPKLDELCSYVDQSISITPDQVVIGLNQILDAISYAETMNIEKSKVVLPQLETLSKSVSGLIASLTFKALILNIPDSIQCFLLALFAIPGVPIHRLSAITFFIIDQMLRLLIEKQQVSLQSFDKMMQHICGFSSFVVHRLRLTPGAINNYLLSIVLVFCETIITFVTQFNNGDNVQRVVNFFIDLFHIDIPTASIQSLKKSLMQIPKISKQKRYGEMIDRMEEPSMITPSKFIVPFQDDLGNYEKKWKQKCEIDYIALFSISCRSIHHQTQASVSFDISDPHSDCVIDLWHSVFYHLQFPGSQVFTNCLTKWMVSDRSLNFQQRVVLIPMNPSIDKPYESFWSIKYSEALPSVRLSLREVLQFTPISLHVAKDVQFSSHALRISGISNYDGVIVVTEKTIRFYQRSKASVQFCEVVLTVQISKVINVRLKTFRHQPTGIELISKDYTCYLFAFDTVNLRDLFIEVLSNSNVPITKTLNTKELTELSKKWIDGSISNFDYLLNLNTLSGRSWNDFTQYPIFPWIIKNYKTERLDLSNPNYYRDLSLPIFAQEKTQQDQCIHYYNTIETLGGEPHCTPNYISNVGSTIYFLVRIEPFTDEEIVFQSGTLDAADRTFQSFDISYSLMTAPGNKNALELVPEFFFNPDVFVNVNSICFPVSPITSRIVNDVVLPPWAKTHREFVYIMRTALESQYVSQNLHQWIDLVWGFRRRGESALEKFNVFQNTVFEFDPKEVIDDRVLFKALRGQIQNCGQAAQGLFKQAHAKRMNTVLQLKGDLVFHSLRKPIAFEKALLNFSMIPERWTSMTTDKFTIKSVRLIQGIIEFNKSGTIVPGIAFSEEISSTCFDLLGTTLVTGHSLPIINLWKIRDNIEHMVSLRCHLSNVTTVKIFGQQWSMLASGHEDGCVSLFSMNPTRFIRVLSGATQMRVSMIRVCLSNGDVIVIQSSSTSIISLWSVNGQFVNSISLQNEIIDAICTSFSEGTRENYIYVLCSDQKIITFREIDLLVLNIKNTNHPNPVSLYLQKEKCVLFVTHSDGFLTCWKIL